MELFELIDKKSSHDVRDVVALKKFFNRRLSLRLFNINCYSFFLVQQPMMTVAWESKDMEDNPLSDDDEHRAQETIMILLENGANINIQNTQTVAPHLGETAFHIACTAIVRPIW